MTPDRRGFVVGAATALLAPRVSAAPMPRVAALGWASAQTLLALGVTPLAMPEIERYRRLVAEPQAPTTVKELGLRPEPNLELLTSLAPSLLVTEPGTDVGADVLERIAPVVTFQALAPGRRPMEVSRASTIALARRLGCESTATAYIAGLDARLDAARTRLTTLRGTPFCVMGDFFANRALVFGGNSLYQDVLDRLGLTNAFHGPTSFYGHATVGLDVLAALPSDLRLLVLSSRVPSLDAILALRPLFRALPYVRARRVTILQDILFYGGLPSADRFARLLVERLPLAAHG